MMGMALVTNCIIENLSERLRQGYISTHFTSEGVLIVAH